MSLFIWAVIGVLGGFALAALLSRKFNHRIAPALVLLASVVALATARWADGQSGADAAALQAQAFIVGHALLAAAAGGAGWLVFARQRWAMLSSAIVSVVFLASLPVSVPFLACAAAGICR